MFRRATDIFIKQMTGQAPLDVGADRIARTAHAALWLLRDIRAELGLEGIPLVWDWRPTSAIEVYPATTLRAYEFRFSGYKKPKQTVERREIIEGLETTVDVSNDLRQKMEASADILDGVVCLLAARDFLLGEAMPPVDRKLAEIEGWIWARDPRLTSRDEQVETAERAMREDRDAFKKLAE